MPAQEESTVVARSREGSGGVRFKRQHIPCPCCGRDDSCFVLSKNSYDLVECRGCRLIFVNPMPVQEEVEEFYRRQYYDQAAFREVMGFPHHYLDERDPVEVQSIVPVLVLLERFQSPATLLDIGCGDGMFLRVAREWGWHGTGVEPSVEAAKMAAAHGLHVINAPVTQAALPEHSFDAISCLQVIEHVLEPVELLRCAHRWLRPGGVLLVSTPNAHSLERRLNGVDWVSFTPPGHLVYFSIPSMRHALELAGFSVETFVTNASVVRPPSLRALVRRWRSSAAGASAPETAARSAEMPRIQIPQRPAALDPVRELYDRVLLSANEWLGRVMNRQGRDLVVVGRSDGAR